MPEHLKTREDIIAWVISLMADASNWEKDYQLWTSHNYCYTPMVVGRGIRDPKSPDDPGLGSLYISRHTNLHGNGGYYLGLYGETAIYVADTWSIRTMLFDPLGRKFRDALFNIEAVLNAQAEKARQEAHARGYQETLEKMSALVGGSEA